MGFTFESVIGVLAASAIVATVQGFTCETSLRGDTNNYGPGVSQEAIDASTPFGSVDQYGAMIAFDESHCVKMCCEQEECGVAVFVHEEAVCYMKTEQAAESHNDVPADGVSSFVISRRIGGHEGMSLEPTECNNKRGVAFGFEDTADLYTLKDGMSWWYNWSPGDLGEGILDASLAQGSEYIPMIWGEGDLTEQRLSHLSWVSSSAQFLLGFNEPNYDSQASLTPKEAAHLWSQVRQLAEDNNLALASPAVNYCYGECIEEDPIRWLDDFFEECDLLQDGCGITHLAVHSYACQVQYLNKHMHSYTKYGLPIWLTEFACGFDGSIEATESYQAEYLAGALTYLELNPHIYRYAWFTAISTPTDGVDNSDMLTSVGGDLTTVGEVFVNHYPELQHCSGGENLATTTEVATSMDDNETGTSSSEPEEPSPQETPTPEPTPEPPVDDGPGIKVTGNDDTSTSGLDVDPEAEVVTNAVITNVGGSGYYNTVVDMLEGADMSCPSFTDSCVKEEVCVSGGLAPFDEVSVAFRGPMNLYNIAWYEGMAGEALQRTSSWAQGEHSENIVFLTNRGGVSGCSGVWSICGGNGQSFADATGTWCASSPTTFDGNLPDDNEMNIMTEWKCASTEECGFFRDVGMRGWSGGEDGTKVMLFEVDMPHCQTDTCTHNRPAVWALNARVLRTAQYGCNCRGQGGNGGCGEFDIIEGVIGNQYSDMLFTHVYDFKGSGSPGMAKYFERPSERATFAAIFKGGDDSYLQVSQLVSWDWGSETLEADQVASMREAVDETYDIYNVDSTEAHDGCPDTVEDTEEPAYTGSVVDSVDGPMLSDEYEYVGCFGDMGPFSERDMALRTKRSFDKNKASVCAARCANENGAVYFGLQRGDLCWCGGLGNSGPGSYGEVENCDTSCPGDDSVTCGGKRASSVYVIPVDHTYIGCFDDKKSDRDVRIVKKAVSSYLTPAACAVHCSSVDGATYFGVQSGRKCFCGDSYGKHGVSTKCDKPCTGDGQQVCGAHNVNSVYTLLAPEDFVPLESAQDNESPSCPNGGHCGCFVDSPPKSLLKNLTMKDSTNLTRSTCRELCAEDDFPFYGLEWSIMCLCGGKETNKTNFLEGLKRYQLDETAEACSMPCEGDENETCGGQNAIEIWET